MKVVFGKNMFVAIVLLAGCQTWVRKQITGKHPQILRLAWQTTAQQKQTDKPNELREKMFSAGNRCLQGRM